MKVENEVDIYEINGNEIHDLVPPKLKVGSHGIYRERVVLKIGRRRLTVIARELKAAIDNATNVVRS